ncbi:MAG: complex I subunit 1/NuoH family protein [Bacteroidota bacterium]
MNTVLFILPFLLAYTVLAVYAERKVSAFIQGRPGPMEVGPYGMLQTVADLIKLIHKEHILPDAATPFAFRLAPILLFGVVFAGLSVIPVGPDWQGAGIDSALFFLLAILTLEIAGILIAGKASGNKYSTLGAIRAVAQIVSYEVPMGLAILTVVVFTGTLDLGRIGLMQSAAATDGFLGISGLPNAGGFTAWNVFMMPALIPVFIIFFICSLAESNRAPFDLPEAESELVAGFHTEYSGFPWAVIMLAEYGLMLLTSLLGAILFFGAWNSPFVDAGALRLGTWTTGPIWGIVWLFTKALVLVLVQIWVRWTYPRVRINQLLAISWKYLTPGALVLLLVTGLWKLLIA